MRAPPTNLASIVVSLTLLAVGCRPGDAPRSAPAGPPEVTSPPTNRIVRLAVAGFASPTEDPTALRQSALLVDLLTSELSASPGFELIERADINRALKETGLALTSSPTNNPSAAIQSGRLLRADWLLLGSFLPVEATNSVLAKIVDAQTGIVRDLTCVAFDRTNALEAAAKLARFVESSRQSVRALNQRLFLALGGIQDLSVNDRFPNFARNLRAVLAQHYRGTRVSVLERSMLDPLLNELRLSLGGLSAGTAPEAAIQPAFVLLDGVYQSYQDTEAKVNCVLRIQKMGGPVITFSGKEPPGPRLDEKIIAAIDRALSAPSTNASASASANANTNAALATRRQEVLRHFKRGVTLMDTPLSTLTAEAIQTKKRMRREAIEAFQAALLLNPEHEKAKFYLAQCLMDPDIGQKEQARDYYREVMATSANAWLVFQSGKALVVSYQGEDETQAIELLAHLRRKCTNLTEQVELMEMQSKSLQVRADARRWPLPARLKFSEEWWRARLTLTRSELQERSNYLSTGRVFGQHCHDFLHFVFRGNAMEAKRHLEVLVPQLATEHPALAPYLIASSTATLAAAFKREAPPDLFDSYLAMLDLVERKPETVVAPASFFGEELLGNLYRYCERRPLALALRLGNILETQGKRHLRTNELDEVNVILAHIHEQEKNWPEAIARLDRIGDRIVRMRTTGPWQPRYQVNGRQAADDVRRRSGAIGVSAPGAPGAPGTPSAPSAPEQSFSLGPPVVKLRQAIAFACDGAQVWIAEGSRLFEFDRSEGRLKPVALNLANSASISQIVATENQVWIATLGDGLLALDKRTRQVRRYTTADGLMLSNLNLLRRIGDRLWIGFGHPQLADVLGGLSYVDLKQQRLVGFSPPLRTNIALTVAEGAFNASAFDSAGPLRNRFEAVGHCTDDSVWLSSRTHGLVRFQFGQRKWERERVSGEFSSLDTNEKFLVLGCRDLTALAGSIYVGLAVFDRLKMKWSNLTTTGGLPGNSVQAVTLDGDKVWVGGRGWLALVNLNTLRVERAEKLGNLRVSRMQIDEGHLWFAAGGQLYQIPRN